MSYTYYIFTYWGIPKSLSSGFNGKANYMPPKLKVGSAEFETCRKISKEPTFNTFTGNQIKKWIIFPKELLKLRWIFYFISLGSMDSKDHNKLLISLKKEREEEPCWNSAYSSLFSVFKSAF
jgi:hypothetical protein